jgi:hypothetical protein
MYFLNYALRTGILPGVVVHAYNTSSEGEDLEDHSLRPAWAKI